MSLPLHFQFEKLQLQGAIQQASDLNELKEVAGQLLDLYFMQKAATARVISAKYQVIQCHQITHLRL